MSLRFLILPLNQLFVIVLLGAAMASVGSAVDVEDHLAGTWSMDDLSPALIYPANKNKFNVLRVSPGKSTWADGYFFMKWSNAARPERGYYSRETGRVWVTTYRFVNQKEQRVEYRGVVSLDENARLIWKGTASTTGAGKVTWEFEARKP